MIHSNRCFKNWYFAISTALLVLMNGCQSIRPVDTSAKRIDQALIEAKSPEIESKPAPVPADISLALLPPLQLGGATTRLTEREGRFDFAAEAVSARQVFMSLVEGTSYSMVVSPDVSGAISLQLKGVTVPEAVAAIREAYGYEYRREGRPVKLISGSNRQSRLF